MPIINQNEVDLCLKKLQTKENELISQLDAIRSQKKALQSIKIEIFTYDDPKTGKTVNQENRQIDELTKEPISETRMREIYTKVLPSVQAL